MIHNIQNGAAGFITLFEWVLVRLLMSAVCVTLQELLLEANGAYGIPFMTHVRLLVVYKVTTTNMILTLYTKVSCNTILYALDSVYFTVYSYSMQ